MKSPLKSRSAKRWLTPRKPICDFRGGCYNNFNKTLGVYVINCKMHKERYEKLLKYAKDARVSVCRIPCVLGKKFTNQGIQQMIRDKILSPQAEMTNIEVSINMSHFNAWRKLLNSCKEYALVLEDDVELKENFISQVNLILNSLQEEGIKFSILHLWNGNWAKTKSELEPVMRISKELMILQEMVPYNAGAVGYVISKSYAKWLIDHMFPIRIPQDMLMGKYPKKGKHLTLKMKWDRVEKCYKSPLLDMGCGGEGGTGTQSTQSYDAPTIRDRFKHFR